MEETLMNEAREQPITRTYKRSGSNQIQMWNCEKKALQLDLSDNSVIHTSRHSRVSYVLAQLIYVFYRYKWTCGPTN